MYNTSWPHFSWKIFVDFLTSTLLHTQNMTLLSKVRWRFFSNFVAFSENPNFTQKTLTDFHGDEVKNNLNTKMAASKKLSFSILPILNIFLRKFQGLILGSVGQIVTTGISSNVDKQFSDADFVPLLFYYNILHMHIYIVFFLSGKLGHVGYTQNVLWFLHCLWCHM